MGNQNIIARDISRIAEPLTKNGCVVIQTCDAYQKYWESFYWSFDKYWDHSIPWPIYFCNEEIPVQMNNPNHHQLLTGVASHSARMAKILDDLKEYDYVFYMLEDFWLTDRMTKEMFIGLFDIMYNYQWDSLRVAPHMPELYKLESTDHIFQNRRILKYAKDSDWRFSQQSSFWKRDFLRSCIVEPKISEVEISSSLSGEIAMDKYMQEKFPDADIYHYHYHWYPISGSVWRGELSQMGEQIDFLRKVDNFLNQQFG